MTIPYRPSAPGVVKSVRQRWLLDYWNRLSRDGAPPDWADLDRAELETCMADITILDVAADGAGPRFRIFAHGKNVGRLYGTDCEGKFLDEVLPDAVREGILETYAQAASARRPVYTVSEVQDSELRPVYYERLLLPFAGAGGPVNRIIGFLEMVSPEGAFDRNRLLSDPVAASGYRIKAVLTVYAAAMPG